MISLVILLAVVCLIVGIWTNSRKTAYWAKQTAWNSHLATLNHIERREAIARKTRNDWLMIPVRIVIAIAVLVFVAKLLGPLTH